jgi:hypothetical protein
MQFFDVLEKNATATAPLPRRFFLKTTATAPLPRGLFQKSAATAPPWTSLMYTRH